MTVTDADLEKIKSGSLDDESLISKRPRAKARPEIKVRPERAVKMPALLQHEVKRTIRRTELRRIVPLADTTIYEMEQRDDFPRRFHLTPRCVVWDLAEVEAWVEKRRLSSYASQMKRAPVPDVRQRKTRPVRQ